MSPATLTTKPSDRVWARGRRQVGEKYLEVAGVVDAEDGTAINVCVGLLVLVGMAAGAPPPAAQARPPLAPGSPAAPRTSADAATHAANEWPAPLQREERATSDTSDTYRPHMPPM
jgi:hypothetical protein